MKTDGTNFMTLCSGGEIEAAIDQPLLDAITHPNELFNVFECNGGDMLEKFVKNRTVYQVVKEQSFWVYTLKEKVIKGKDTVFELFCVVCVRAFEEALPKDIMNFAQAQIDLALQNNIPEQISETLAHFYTRMLEKEEVAVLRHNIRVLHERSHSSDKTVPTA